MMAAQSAFCKQEMRIVCCNLQNYQIDLFRTCVTFMKKVRSTIDYGHRKHHHLDRLGCDLLRMSKNVC